MILPYLICAHLVGDFVLQNEWMQRKSKSSFVCAVHVLCYSIPFVPFLKQHPGLLAVILIEHWLQDRFSLHLLWMKFFKQTSPDKWPTGPLCVDQAMHIGFIGAACWLAGVDLTN